MSHVGNTNKLIFRAIAHTHTAAGSSSTGNVRFPSLTANSRLERNFSA